MQTEVALTASITIHNLENELKLKLRVRADRQGTSLEEEARRILCGMLDERPQVADHETRTESKQRESTDDEFLDELEKRGVLLRSRKRWTPTGPGKHVPGALERFLAERHSG